MKEFEFEILQTSEGDCLFYSLPDSTGELNLQEKKYESKYRAYLQSDNEQQLLEDLYYIFNVNHPKDYTGRSLSISDIVKVNDDKCYYCNACGWKLIKCS